MQNRPTEYSRRHLGDFKKSIEEYILPFSHEKAEELMHYICDIYEEIGYPPLLSRGLSFFDVPTQKAELVEQLLQDKDLIEKTSCAPTQCEYQ